MILTTLWLTACAPSTQPGQDKKQVYIDARLLFSISYPQIWAPFISTQGPAGYAANAVNWRIRQEELQTDRLDLTVFSLPAISFIPELDLMQEMLTDIYPNAAFSATGTDDLPAGLAVVLDGYTPHKTFRAWIINQEGRHYLLVCASPPEKFAEQIPLFETIIDSFQILRAPHHDQTDRKVLP